MGWPSCQTFAHPCIRFALVLWPSRPSSDLPGQSQARQKIRFHSLSGPDSAVTPVWVQCRVQKIIIEYQNALSPVLLSSLQLFASLLSLALSRQCLLSKCLEVGCWSKLALLATSLAISSIENTQL